MELLRPGVRYAGQARRMLKSPVVGAVVLPFGRAEAIPQAACHPE
jgi:hypothetical protein